MSRSTVTIGLLVLLSLACSASAQQVQLTTPVVGVSDSFFERIGTGWNVEGRNWFFRFPGLNAAPPPFGGWDPGGDARFGFGGRSGSTRWGFNMALQQGSNRSLVGQAPTIVVPNGYGGSIFDGQVRPFVTGLVPVVGQRNWGPLFDRADQLRQQRDRKMAEWTAAVKTYQAKQAQEAEGQVQAGAHPVRTKRRAGAALANPAKANKDDAPLSVAGRAKVTATKASGGGGFSAHSSATRGDLSVKEIKRQHAQQDRAKQAEIARLIEQGRGAESLGKKGVAKIFYRQAANRASGDLRRQLLDKIKTLSADKRYQPSK